MRNLADFDTAVSRLEAWLCEDAGARSAPGDARSYATNHLIEHGSVDDDPSRALHACAGCATTFTTPVEQVESACPRCGQPAAPVPHGGRLSANEVCGYVRAWGRCGYRGACKVCGVAAVLFDLELALADRSARAHTLELTHGLTKATETYERAESDYARERVVRNFQQNWPAMVDAFVHGQARHRDESTLRVRSQVEAIQARGLPEGAQLRGQSQADLEALFPVTRAGDVADRILESDPLLGLVAPSEAARGKHVDPDRHLLGGLQDHLDAHGFSYGEIAHLMPDGEGGTAQEQRDRVKNRLQHRHRDR